MVGLVIKEVGDRDRRLLDVGFSLIIHIGKRSPEKLRAGPSPEQETAVLKAWHDKIDKK